MLDHFRYIINYFFRGGISYTMDSEYLSTYATYVGKYLIGGFLLSYYFVGWYDITTFALSVLLADIKFYIDASYYIEQYGIDETD